MFELFRHHIIHNDTVDILQGRVVNGDTTDFGLDYLESEVFGENQLLDEFKPGDRIDQKFKPFL